MIFANTGVCGDTMLTPSICLYISLSKTKAVFLQVFYISSLIVFFTIVVFITFPTETFFNIILIVFCNGMLMNRDTTSNDTNL